MPFQVGSVVDGYEFIDIVDSSRSGVAYKVRNLKQDRIELLRVLSKALQDDPEHFERFLRESRVHSRLLHPNIVTFFGAFMLAGEPVMTTEYVDGVTLAARMEAGPTAFPIAIEYVSQVLAALRCAHELEIVHRSVTPENIIITAGGRLKLTGFTYARSAADPRLTKVGVSLGDVHYMSPEQVRGLPNIDQRSDLYSCGLVLYQLLTGQRAFESMSQFEVMAAQVNMPPRRPSRICQRLPLGSDSVVLKALAKDAGQRYQTATEFLRELEMLLTDSAILDNPLPPPAPLPPPIQPAPKAPPQEFYPQQLKPAVSAPTAHQGLSRINSTDALVVGATLILVGAVIVLIRL